MHDLKCERCELTKEVMVVLREALRDYAKIVTEMVSLCANTEGEENK